MEDRALTEMEKTNGIRQSTDIEQHLLDKEAIKTRGTY